MKVCSCQYVQTVAVDEKVASGLQPRAPLSPDDDDGYGPLAEKELEEHFNRAVSILRERRPDLLKEHNMSLDTFKASKKLQMQGTTCR
jgi:hypothetical protein